jgi:hypothetical protein
MARIRFEEKELVLRRQKAVETWSDDSSATCSVSRAK